jgi:RHS repeat-associated protein
MGLNASGADVVTTTYGYDAFGARVYQIASTTATTTYPFKFFSVASSTRSGTNYSTTTEYVFNGDTLLATVDQGFRNGVATGTAQTRYIHPDHLGSTNVVTNASGTVVQTLDFYPYGATRISSSVGGADSARKFIGQFSDQSNLSYLNARYYSSDRGQFLSQDPVSEPKQQNLQDPQSLNSYSYANDNPITKSDPSGKCAGPLIVPCIFIIGAGISSATTYAGDVLSNINNGNRNPYTDNLSSPGAYVIGDLSGGASLAFLQEYRAYASGLEFVSSLAQDDANGNPRNYRKAGIAAGTTLLTGVAFEAGIGRTAAKQATAPITGSIFGNANSLALQNAVNSYRSPQIYSNSIQTRQQAAQSYNSGLSGGGGSGSSPSPNSLWVTPSGAVVTFSGTLVSAPPSK